MICHWKSNNVPPFLTSRIFFCSFFFCIRLVNLDAATLNKRLSAAYNVGTTPRYADFEKTANKTLLMSIDGQPPTSAAAGGVYPTPYATLPMGAEVSFWNNSSVRG